MRSLLTLLMASAALTLGACGNDDAGSATASTPPVAATGSDPASTTPSSDNPPQAATGDEVDVTEGKCAEVARPAPKDQDTPEPKGKLDASKKNVVTLKTSCGTIVLELDAKTYPKTANAVATLVKNGYWDFTAFHRVVPGFVIQGGDPTSTGTGGPEWKVVEAPKSTAKYPEGTLAMAKTGDDPPGTTQSQFFIMVGDDGLPPEYAIAGKVTKGMNVARAIEALGDAANPSGTPTKQVVILKATFKAS